MSGHTHRLVIPLVAVAAGVVGLADIPVQAGPYSLALLLLSLGSAGFGYELARRETGRRVRSSVTREVDHLHEQIWCWEHIAQPGQADQVERMMEDSAKHVEGT